MSSVFGRLLDGSGVVGGNLALTVHGADVTTLVRKLPIIRLDIDSEPLLLVAASPKPESSRPFSTGGEQDVVYSVQFVLAVSSIRAPVEGMPDLMEARELLRRAFQRPTLIRAAGLTECLMTTVIPDAPLARAKFFQNHEASGLTVQFRCVEPAS